MAHIIPRSHGGLGVEQNVVGLCRECHDLFDHGRPEERKEKRRQIDEYMNYKYGENWNPEDYRYKKVGY